MGFSWIFLLSSSWILRTTVILFSLLFVQTAVWAVGLSPCEGEGMADTAWTEAADAPTPNPCVGHHSHLGRFPLLTVETSLIRSRILVAYSYLASFRGNWSCILLLGDSMSISSNPCNSLFICRTYCLQMERTLKPCATDLWWVGKDSCNMMTVCLQCSLTTVTVVTTMATAAIVYKYYYNI